ncbi:MAG: phosphatase PAP2 family protein [Beijerinckiaceae bacterium]|nr:phosphatase PAP2 family protein [Beijerinckiaceae bacterium]
MQNEPGGESGLKARGLRAWQAARLAPADSRALLALVIVIAGIVVFARLAAYVTGDTPGEFDVRLITALRNPADLSDPIGPGWLEEAMRDLTALGGTIVLLIVSCAAFAFLHMTGKTHAAYLLAASVIGAMILSQLLKFGISRPRPELVPHATRVYTQSFPSGHAMMSAAVYLTLAALLARTQRLARVRIFIIAVTALITGLVGASRVYLGVHWPTDVLAGWVGGAAWAILCWVVMYWLQRRGKVEKADAPALQGADVDAAS